MTSEFLNSIVGVSTAESIAVRFFYYLKYGKNKNYYNIDSYKKGLSGKDIQEHYAARSWIWYLKNNLGNFVYDEASILNAIVRFVHDDYNYEDSQETAFKKFMNRYAEVVAEKFGVNDKDKARIIKVIKNMNLKNLHNRKSDRDIKAIVENHKQARRAYQNKVNQQIKNYGKASLTSDTTKAEFIKTFGRLANSGAAGWILRVWYAPWRERKQLAKITNAQRNGDETKAAALREEFLKGHSGYNDETKQKYTQGVNFITSAANAAYDTVFNFIKIKPIANLAANIANIISHAIWNARDKYNSKSDPQAEKETSASNASQRYYAQEKYQKEQTIETALKDKLSANSETISILVNLDPSQVLIDDVTPYGIFPRAKFSHTYVRAWAQEQFKGRNLANSVFSFSLKEWKGNTSLAFDILSDFSDVLAKELGYENGAAFTFSEVMKNAVTHGNHGDFSKPFYIYISENGEIFVINEKQRVSGRD